MKRISLVFGTRPEAVKMAPVIWELRKHPEEFTTSVCLTAQHREMLDQVLDFFNISSDHDLDIMKAKQSLYDVTIGVLAGLQGYLATERPDLVLVHGDTTTTFAATLAAFYQQIPVGHVEAGLRTGKLYDPFPEEANRHLCDALCHLLFAPTETSRENLLREGLPPERVVVTGNTAIDALQLAIGINRDRPTAAVFPPDRRKILVTAHRRESFGPGIAQIVTALHDLAVERSDVHIVYPVHRNPEIHGPVHARLSGLDNVSLLPPMDYDAFVGLMQDCDLILTDSGGIQEEAPSLGKPVLVLRDCTERPEAVTAGTVAIVGTDPQRIRAEVDRLLDDAEAYAGMARAINPYGDGKAAGRIVAAIREYFAGGG